MPTTTYNALFGNEAPYVFDPSLVGSDIGKYYTAALSAQPGYNAILRNISGVLSPQAKYTMAQGAAERGVGIGSYGGANDATALLKALGTSSQELSNLGLQQYQQAYGNVPAVQPGTLYLSEADKAKARLEWEMNQANTKAAMDRLKAQLASAETTARWREETDLSRLAAENRWAEVNQQYFDKWGRGTTGTLSGLASRLGSDEWATPSMVPVSAYGTLQEPTPTPVEPLWTYGTATSPAGSGSVYFGGNLPGAAAEESVLWGQTSPWDYGVQPDYYDLGAGAEDVQNYMDYFGYEY